MKAVVAVGLVLSMAFASDASGESLEGRYCELQNAETDDGRDVDGSCYMYSDTHGQLTGAETEDGEEVTGSCYSYSESYGAIDSAETESGVDVSGDCYFAE
jgi:hypothetical protein